jgi:hypothetical protein
MKPAATASRRFPSKFLLTVIPGLVASGVAASVLYAVHVSRGPSVSEYLAAPTQQGDGLSAEERRDLTRQMLKARRENAQEPAQVRPSQPAAEADSVSGPMDADTGGVADVKASDAKAVDANMADAKSPDNAKYPEPKVVDTKAADIKTTNPNATNLNAPTFRPAPDHATAAAPLPAARPPIARTHPDAPAAAAAPAQPAVASVSGSLPPQAGAAPAAGPMHLGPPPAAPYGAAAPAGPVPPPVAMAAPPPAPEPRGFAGNVFSGLSTIAGSAANATGNTVNWVIDLPGKAINASGKAIAAGGKLIGIDSNSADQPAEPPPPATASPPRRNF